MKKAISKTIISATICALIFLMGIPTAIAFVFGKGEDDLGREKIGTWENSIKVPETIQVWRTGTGQVEKVDFEEYVCRVVASEMPSSFHQEALKAQSVAARTYAMAKIIKYEERIPEAHEKSPICDTTHCQVYRSESELCESHSKEWMESEEGFLKVKKACKETEGKLLYYEGSLVMQPLFFSSSGGQTEDSQDVFSGALPYLVSVPSPYEERATHQNERKSMDVKEFEEAMKTYLPNENFGEITKDNIKVVSRTKGGRVETIMVGNCRVKGTDVRSAMGLSSALFSVGFRENQDSGWDVIFISNGFGHGVGMSQYGADGMAEEGYGYEDILRHYYSGTEVH